MPKCYNCSHELRAETDYGRQDTCLKCRASTHVCKNCLHYDTSRYNECAENIADRVVDKEKANFCDHFKPVDPKGGAASDKREQLLNAAEALFKKK